MTHLLTINTGSSSLKAAVYDMGHGEAIVLVVQFERIGQPHSRVRIMNAERETLCAARPSSLMKTAGL